MAPKFGEILKLMHTNLLDCDPTQDPQSTPFPQFSWMKHEAKSTLFLLTKYTNPNKTGFSLLTINGISRLAVPQRKSKLFPFQTLTKTWNPSSTTKNYSKDGNANKKSPMPEMYTQLQTCYTTTSFHARSVHTTSLT